MKSKSTCVSHMALITVLVGLLFFVLVLSGTAPGKIEPQGTNIGAVRFDAVIKLNRYSPDSSGHEYTLIFARYWVARNYYSVAVVWAEPQSTDLHFAIRPPTLSFTSNKQTFKVRHELNTKYNETYEKPSSKRGVIRHKFGSYPVDNIRFAEQEALAERIYTVDLRGFEDANQAAVEVPDISIPACEGGDTRDVSQLKIKTSGERIDSLQLFNTGQRLLKDISYEYENNAGKTFLRKQTVVLPERPLMVGFKGDGMKVTLDGKEYWYRDLQATHHAGGRTCTVEYEPVMLGDKEVTLPMKVTVCNRKDGRILRCVQMMNFKQVELDADGAEEEARQFGGFTADQHKYWQLREKYWDKEPAQVEKEDVEAIKQMRSRINNALVSTGNSTGEKLKYLNVLIELNRIVGDESELERHYQSYLSTLSENKLIPMTLVGGYGVIETSMFRKRCCEASKLLGRWVETALVINDADSILLFARRQLAKKRLWTTVVLLETLLNKKQPPNVVRFEAEALRCTALDELCKLLRTDDIAKKGLLAEVQANWVASIGKDNLNTMLVESVDQAKRYFAELSEPTESQQALKAQLDKIDPKAVKDESS